MSNPRLNPDSLPVILAISTGTALVFLASFALSFNALVDVAGWARVPGWLSWAVPVMLDVALVVYSLSALVRRARGQSARFSWFLLASFTLVSLLGNAAHSLGVPGAAQPFIGTVVVALAPVAALAALENLAGLIVASTHARTVPVSTPDGDVWRTDNVVMLRELTDAEADELDILSTLASTHPQSKRTRDNLALILSMHRRGERHQNIAQTVGMSRTLVDRAIRDMESVGLVRAA
ncbi:DUF2637 domain-containing protein [Krasilnikoviella flava]|uniref:Homeodomain-like domain-containing protein n=1 Tax=Krasilnikoviella flava TaxID=526729 RepID=A0A1T5LP79_9MICO|nr:DUF2637 domain-containing protein [Krasilnikoviella flava]SKC77685.1 Protein of unknown function [Krasilnikoviella flava]